MNTLIQDLRFALRQLRRSPGFALSVVLVLSLGIGANAALFTVLSGTLLRQLPFVRPSQLVAVKLFNNKELPLGGNLLDLGQWQARSRTLSSIAYYNEGADHLSLPNLDQPVNAPVVSPNLFSTLGVQPAIGRSFTAEEQQPGRSHVVILSDILWKTHFQSDPTILGRTIQLEDTPYTVIGVMPPNFAFPVNPSSPQIWKLVELTSENQSRDYKALEVQVIARRNTNFSISATQNELDGIEQSLRPLYSGELGPVLAPSRLQVLDYRSSLNQKERPALLALLAAVAILWLIACANAASLMLARGAARRREIAIRGALGASRWRLVRQLLAESSLLALAAAATGLLLSQTLLFLFRRVLVRQLGPALPDHPSLPVLGALLVLTAVSVLIFGVLPSLLATRFSIEQSLRQDGVQSGAAHSQQRLQRVLVVSELALTLALVFNCGLLLRTVLALRNVPLGFRIDHIVVIEPKLPTYKFRGQDIARSIYFPFLNRIRQIPGVDAASLTTVVPLSETFDTVMNLYLTGSNGSKPKDIRAKMRASSPEMQQVFGFHMLKGRYFNQSDNLSSQPVAVVNRAFAQLYDPANGDLIDRFTLTIGKDRKVRIIGVVDDFHQVGVADAPAPEIDFCLPQMLPTDSFYSRIVQSHVEFALRTTLDPRAVLPDVQRILNQVSPGLNSSSVRTMDQVVDDSIGSQLLAAHLLETLGGLALLVALAGLYSLLAYFVTLRTRELGLRLALGAQRSDILTLVLRSAGVLLFTGTVIGIGISLLSARLLGRFLFGVRQYDPLTLVVASILLLLVGIIAAWLPARRAAALEPMQALRTE